jgi:hypothetical protein
MHRLGYGYGGDRQETKTASVSNSSYDGGLSLQEIAKDICVEEVVHEEGG